MKPNESTKPNSYLKAHTAEAIGQDLKSYEETQESLALLKIIAQSRKSIERTKRKTVAEAFNSVRGRAAEC